MTASEMPTKNSPVRKMRRVGTPSLKIKGGGGWWVVEEKGSRFRPQNRGFPFPFLLLSLSFRLQKPHIFQKADSITRKNKAAVFAFGGPFFFFLQTKTRFSASLGKTARPSLSSTPPGFNLHDRPKLPVLVTTSYRPLAIPNAGRFLFETLPNSRGFCSLAEKNQPEQSRGSLSLNLGGILLHLESKRGLTESRR